MSTDTLTEEFPQQETTTLFDLVTTCDATEALLTWAGAATVFVIGSEGRLAWRLTSRSGGDAPVPSQAALELVNAADVVWDTLKVCLEPSNVTDPLLWADVAWTQGGPHKAFLTVAFADGTTEVASILVEVRDTEPGTEGGGGGSDAGTVTSVGLSMPAEYVVSGSPVTTNGTISVSKAAQAAHLVYAGPTSGADAPPAFRTLSVSDIPDLPAASGGTVQSVDLAAPPEFVVSGNPVTNTGTLTLSKAAQAANRVWAGPVSGGDTSPAFRPLVPNDIPNLTLSKVTDAGTAASHNDTEYEHVVGKGSANGYAPLNSASKVPTANLPAMVGSGASHAAGLVPDPGATAGTGRFLREDGTWAAMATGAPNLANGQVTASGTAGTLVAARATRRYVTIKNLDAAISVYVGAATVTAGNGMPLKAGESVSLDCTGLVQVIAASGSPVVAYAEVYD